MAGGVCGALVILLGLTVLVGWGIHSAFLVQVSPDLAPMQRNTAASFILGGLAFLGIVTSRTRFTLICSAMTASVVVGTLLEYLFRVDFGIDQLLGAGYITTHTSDPGRMSPTTALCFLVLAAGLMLAQTKLLADTSAVLGVTRA